jgi:hypothetical protein
MSYSPSDLVRHMHGVPHIKPGKGLHRTDNTFGMSDGVYWNSYTQSLLPLPIIIAIIGTLALFSLGVAFCFRCCWRGCKCGPNDKSTEFENARFYIMYLPRIILVFVLFAVIVDQTTFFGNRDLDNAIRVVDEAMDFLDVSFTALYNDGVELVNMGQYLYDNATTAVSNGCPGALVLEPQIQQFNVDIQGYMAEVEPLPGYIDSAQQSIHKYGVEDKNYSIWVLYCVSMVNAILFAVGTLVKSKSLLQTNMLFSVVLQQALIVFCCIQMIMLVSNFTCPS